MAPKFSTQHTHSQIFFIINTGDSGSNENVCENDAIVDCIQAKNKFQHTQMNMNDERCLNACTHTHTHSQ